MVTAEIIEYVKSEKAKGVNDALIRQSLMTHGGWTDADIDEALAIATAPLAPRVENSPVATIINNTNAAGAVVRPPVTKPGSKVIDPALVRYRTNLKFTLFGIIMFLGVLYLALAMTMGGSLSDVSSGLGLLGVIAVVVAGYIASAFTVKLARPRTTVTTETLAFVGYLFFAIILTLTVGFAFFFVTCLALFSIGSLGGL